MDSTPQSIADRFSSEIEMYKFHLDIAIKAGLFVFGITGAIISYLLANLDQSIALLSLAVPLLLNGGFMMIFFLGIFAAIKMEENHKTTCAELPIKPYDMRPLAGVCITMSLLCAVVTTGIVVLTSILMYQPTLWEALAHG